MKPVGTRFGMLTISKILNPSRKHGTVECTCDCGKVLTIAYKYLSNKLVNSCGCCSREQAQKNGHYKKYPKSSLVGQTFGRLTVIKEVEKENNNRKRYWLCKCTCNKEIIVEQGNLKNHLTQSCGCLRKEKAVQNNPTHLNGLSETRLYQTWYNMKERCYNKERKDYEYYGKIGITVCEEWKSNFLSFYEWAINNGYEDDLTIDRVNPYGNYEPTNCRWATRKEQAHNKRRK